MDEFFFLTTLNEDSHGKNAHYVTNHDQWQRILTTARANGWKPQGTILDYEFQYQVEVSHYEDLDQEGLAVIERQVQDKCRGWQGGYLTPEYQMVTNEDAMGLRKALLRARGPVELILFLSCGAFRIAR